jgi:xanthine dehydrogenase accessory factor
MLPSIYSELESCLEAGHLIVLATIVDGPGVGRQLLIRPGGQTLGDLGSRRLNQQAALHGEQIAPTFESGRKSLSLDSESLDVFFEVLPPPSEMIIVGAVHVAIPLIGFSKALGFKTTVIDPRGSFATPERFAAADLLINSWPRKALADVGLHSASHVVVLSHDLKIDLPALEVALKSPARYIGALGSKKTHKKRIAALQEGGFTDAEIARIHAPIGLDLGGRRAEEIALSIIAQIVAVDHGVHETKSE